MEALSYLHPLAWDGETLPAQFTYPFRYTPHPLCVKAAAIVQERLKEMGIEEGKMYGVLVARQEEKLVFLAAYSGQLNGSYAHPWFVPPVVDYLDPNSHFQKEQAEIVKMSQRIEAMRRSEEIQQLKERLTTLQQERENHIKKAVEERKLRISELVDTQSSEEIRLMQYLKAEIHRAKQLHKDEIAAIEHRLAEHNEAIRTCVEERKRRSEALQEWLFNAFSMLDANGNSKTLTEIWNTSETTRSSLAKRALIPSGAGECCAPKLLQAAYRLGLQPLAMAEFWWGPSTPGLYKQPGAFYPACHSKCRPILGHMLQGLNVEPDPAEHYEQVVKPLRVVWEDAYLAVIEKPKGWCSIPGKSDQANIFDEALRRWPEIEGSIVAHRLDQDTSGVMVIAKTPRVHRALSQQFERREVEKRYVALLSRMPEADQQGGGLISLPLAPDLEDMPRQRVDKEHGKEAVTRYEVVGRTGEATRVLFYPETGRTHQLRVHAAAPEGLNAPIVGDRLYGQVADRLYLHAEAITFTHPITGERMHFEVKAPF
ncbi:MAG: RNA pseudouridine synthase [Bacteroidaceae bacterium]|nr:RNA pseudouridine synthase [Bacteroidaceae bacterium]